MNPISSSSYVGVDQRSAPRTDVYARIPVVLEDGRTATVTVVNISADGLLMRHETKLAEGSLIAVSLPVIGKIKARAIWSLGGRSGISFLEAIEMRDYNPLLRALGAAIAA
jgi:hypothetical protein